MGVTGQQPAAVQDAISSPSTAPTSTKYLTKLQVADIVKNRPNDVSPEDVLKGLVARGYTLEGYNEGAAPFSKTDATPAGGFLSPAPASSPSVGGFFGNVVKGVANTIGDVAKLGFNAIFHPKKTLESFGDPLVGLVGKVIPGAATQQQTQTANMIGEYFKQRYGGIENIKKTAYEDPFGFALDLSVVLDAGASLVSKAGQITKVADLAKAADTLRAGSLAADPFAAAAKTAGKAADLTVSGRSIAPFASKLDAEAIAAAERMGIKLPASAMSESKPVATLESLGGKGLFGGKIADAVDAAGEKLVQFADDTVKSAGGATDASTLGNKILQGYDTYKTAFTQLKNDLYKQVDLKGINATTPKSIEFLDKLIADEKSALTALGQKTSPELRFYENLKTGLSGNKKGLVRATDLYNGIQKIEKQINFDQALATGDKAALRKLTATISGELDSAIGVAKPEMKAALDKANAYYQQGLDVLNSDIGNKIYSLRDTPDKVAEAVLHQGISADDIPRLIQIIGPENVPNLRANLLEKIVNDAESVSTGKFKASGIAAQLKKYGESKLAQLLQPEQMQALKDMDNVAKALQRGAKVAEGSQTAYIARLATIAGSVFANPLLAVKLLVGDVAFSKFIASSAGQRLLTEGYVIPQVGEKLRALSEYGGVLSKAAEIAKTAGAGQGNSAESTPESLLNK